MHNEYYTYDGVGHPPPSLSRSFGGRQRLLRRPPHSSASLTWTPAAAVSPRDRNTRAPGTRWPSPCRPPRPTAATRPWTWRTRVVSPLSFPADNHVTPMAVTRHDDGSRGRRRRRFRFPFYYVGHTNEKRLKLNIILIKNNNILINAGKTRF